MKICTKCKLEKEVIFFYKSKKTMDGHRTWCKQCEKEAHQKWVKANPEKVAILNKKFTTNNPEKKKANSG
jgi:superfamily II helicase